MPVKSGTMAHVQNAYKEAIAEGIKGVIGTTYNASKMYILNGLANSVSAPAYNIAAGSVFYNGEVYLVDAATFTSTVPNVAVLSLNITYATGSNADGVEFTDGTVRNVHEIRKMIITSGLGGSGLSNYADCERINTNQPNVNIIQGTGIGVSGTYPNITVTNTSPAQPSPILRSRKIILGDMNTDPGDGYTTRLSGSTNSLTAFVHTFPSAMAPGTQYFPILQVGNAGHDNWGGFNDNYMVCALTGAYDHEKMYFAVQTTASGSAQSIDLYYMCIAI